MDLGTDYCSAWLPLALLRLSQKVLGGCLEVIAACVSCLLAHSCLLNERARGSSSRQAITPARYDEGILHMVIMPQQGRGDTTTLAHPKGLHMQIHRRIRREPNPSGELGEWIEDAALHNLFPHH